VGIRFNQKNKEDKPITGIIPVTTVPCHEKTENVFDEINASLELDRQKRYARAAFASEMKSLLRL